LFGALCKHGIAGVEGAEMPSVSSSEPHSARRPRNLERSVLSQQVRRVEGGHVRIVSGIWQKTGGKYRGCSEGRHETGLE
jgi:hypothetical protein